jgi:hypothetical protein
VELQRVVFITTKSWCMQARKGETGMKAEAQTSLRMPEELRERLAQAATAAGRSMGEEIRRRLEASFGSAPAAEDQQTSDVLFLAGKAAEYVARRYALAWHQDRYAGEAFAAAVRAFITDRLPPGDPVPPPAARGRPAQEEGEDIAFYVVIG